MKGEHKILYEQWDQFQEICSRLGLSFQVTGYAYRSTFVYMDNSEYEQYRAECVNYLSGVKSGTEWREAK